MINELIEYSSKQEQQYFGMSENRSIPYWTGRADSWKEVKDYLESLLNSDKNVQASVATGDESSSVDD